MSAAAFGAARTEIPAPTSPLSAVRHAPPRFLWLDLTRKCRLRCTYCHNAPGTGATHGTMTRDDWISVLDQAVRFGIHKVQFVLGEPHLHPEFPALLDHALHIRLEAETYSSSAPVASRCRESLRHPGSLGLKCIGVAPLLPFRRGADGREPSPSGLCGRCGDGVAAVGADGGVSPCVFTAGWLHVGNVRRSPLAAILSSPALTKEFGPIRSSPRSAGSCDSKAECIPIPGGECIQGNHMTSERDGRT
ncbi:radical SAM/SPASM domain-containing protein [Streptomyces monomycini]|uniref:radical SAM/SPASM domain-containing protein n=1 Tax=Streptomyces monomycini TaxID=371720 RepID=UPI000996D157|nr:radical SAM/SPASM domain-containing protein [Streptomyces monomycini]